MGTVVSFLVESEELSDDEVNDALDAACSELHRLDDRFSPWKDDSELSLLRGGTVDRSSALMDEVFELCATASNISEGYFDP
ncbi:MAG: FAD:protein FMN transferase, partial [Acidobacteriaceae bacterium]